MPKFRQQMQFTWWKFIFIFNTSVILPACSSPSPTTASSVETEPKPILEWRGGVTLTMDNPNFGGLSSLEISDDGTTATAISDRGYKFSIKLRYDETGILTEVNEIKALGALKQPKGKTIKNVDAEGQTKFRNGTLISLERKHALWWYKSNKSQPKAQAIPKDMKKLPHNEGIEALTTLNNGNILLIAEGGEKNGTLPAWIGTPEAWKSLSYPFDGSFRPTDAAVLPNGNVLVLERQFSLAIFSWRLMLIDQTSIIPKTVMKNHPLATFSYALNYNMEGLAVRVNTAGEILIYVIADDNFLPIQQTVLMQFVLHLNQISTIKG